MAANTTAGAKACLTCSTIPPVPKHCSKCKTATNCSRDCQRADWSKHKKTCRAAVIEQDQASSASSALPAKVNAPFTAIAQNTYLHTLSKEQAFNTLIDCVRMRQEDAHKFDNEVLPGTVLDGKSSSEAALRTFITKAGDISGFLPPWWDKEKTMECVQHGLQEHSKFSLTDRTSKEDVQKRWGDGDMPMKMRLLAEVVYGRGVGGANGKSLLEMQSRMEQGDPKFKYHSKIDLA